MTQEPSSCGHMLSCWCCLPDSQPTHSHHAKFSLTALLLKGWFLAYKYPSLLLSLTPIMLPDFLFPSLPEPLFAFLIQLKTVTFGLLISLPKPMTKMFGGKNCIVHVCLPGLAQSQTCPFIHQSFTRKSNKCLLTMEAKCRA